MCCSPSFLFEDKSKVYLLWLPTISIVTINTMLRHLLLSWCILLTIADAFSSYSQRSRSGFVSLNASPKGDKSEIISALNEEFEYQGRIDVPDPDFRCGFLSLIGAANMGKSTLLNALIGEELCTATSRPQTTRHSILGVLTSEEQKVQLLFLDTPGVIGETAYKLQEGMMEAVAGAFRDADVVLLDDPLSAVDSRVGRLIFYSAIQDLALKRGKCVVLGKHVSR